MGALILFGCVQATMIIFALFKGERPNVLEWLGLMIAIVGLVYLVLPGLSAPPFFSSLLMAFAGIAWGFYTLRGKQSTNPLADTAGNFIRAVPFVLIALLPFISDFHYSKRGILFAVLSGAIASGIGYAVWYAALKFHTATRAAILQLSVPILAAIGGVLLLSETVTMRLTIAGNFDFRRNLRGDFGKAEKVISNFKFLKFGDKRITFINGLQMKVFRVCLFPILLNKESNLSDI